MKGILCGTSAKTNEEYKKVIRQRMNIMVMIALIGAATLAIVFLAEVYWDIEIKEYMLGFYAGGGTGLFIIGIAFWIKNKLLLGNEEMLKKSRLNNTDERNMEISNKAFRFAALIMIVVMYGVALIGGLFYPILVKTALLVIIMFLLAYGAAYQVYNKRM